LLSIEELHTLDLQFNVMGLDALNLLNLGLQLGLHCAHLLLAQLNLLYKEGDLLLILRKLNEPSLQVLVLLRDLRHLVPHLLQQGLLIGLLLARGEERL
jgi:hypothetical protein